MISDPNIRIDNGIKKIDNLISSSRLIVYSYDSTGMLGTIRQHSNHSFLDRRKAILDSAKPYYQLLADVRIIHFSPIFLC